MTELLARIAKELRRHGTSLQDLAMEALTDRNITNTQFQALDLQKAAGECFKAVHVLGRLVKEMESDDEPKDMFMRHKRHDGQR